MSDKPSRATNAALRAIEDAELQHRCLVLRKRGLTYDQVALALREEGIDRAPGTIASMMKRYLEKLARDDSETAEQMRVLENARLDELLVVWGPKARAGDEKAAGIVLKIAQQRARLNGLETQKIEHNVSGTILHSLGVDPAELAREREAFDTAFKRPGLPDPAARYDAEGSAEEIDADAA